MTKPEKKITEDTYWMILIAWARKRRLYETDLLEEGNESNTNSI